MVTLSHRHCEIFAEAIYSHISLAAKRCFRRGTNRCGTRKFTRLFVFLGCLQMGCGLEPDRISITIDVPDRLITTKVSHGGDQRVGIITFEDKRRQPSVLGVKISPWGSPDVTFILKGANLGEETTRAFFTYLRKRGWQPILVQPVDSTWPRLIVSGEIVKMNVLANSTWFSTNWTSEIVLLLEGRSQGIETRFTAKLTSARSRRVFWFRSEDAALFVSETLSDVFDQGLSQIAMHVDTRQDNVHQSAHSSSRK